MTTVAVLGAGIAGATAANRLAENGVDVTVFEARDRVGGRMWSERVQVNGQDYIIERGAEWVLDGYDEMHALIEKCGLTLVDTGMSYYVRTPADMPEVTTDDIIRAGRAAVELTKTLEGNPSAEDVLSKLDLPADLVEAMRSRIEISSNASAGELTAAVLEHAASMEPKPSYRIGGGNQQLPQRLLEPLGDAVRLGEAVLSVLNEGSAGVSILTDRGSYEFDYVIVALPLAIIRDAAAVKLPSNPARENALSGIVQGDAAKLHLLLNESVAPSAVMSVRDRYWTWTALDQSGTVPPVLNAFMGSKDAIQRANLESHPERWGHAVKALRPDLKTEGDLVITTLWPQDPFTRGGYSAHSPAVTEDDIRELEEPIGAVYWAGEYTEPVYTGLMEGAIRSAQRAVDRIVERAGRS